MKHDKKKSEKLTKGSRNTIYSICIENGVSFFFALGKNSHTYLDTTES